LVLSGHLYNQSSDVQKPPLLFLKVLSPSGEYVGQKTEKCCTADILPFEPTPFRMELELPPGPIGSYDLTLKN
jgi:hypothetical protein